jgi:hypothetical protein
MEDVFHAHLDFFNYRLVFIVCVLAVAGIIGFMVEAVIVVPWSAIRWVFKPREKASQFRIENQNLRRQVAELKAENENLRKQPANEGLARDLNRWDYLDIAVYSMSRNFSFIFLFAWLSRLSWFPKWLPSPEPFSILTIKYGYFYATNCIVFCLVSLSIWHFTWFSKRHFIIKLRRKADGVC